MKKVKSSIVLIVLISIIAAPSIFTLYSIHKYGVNVLFWDEWAMVPLVQKHIDGTITFTDLFAQHSEHRKLFPQIVMLGIIELTNFNSVDEMYFSWIISVLAFSLIIKMYMYGKDSNFSISSLLMFLPISYLFFTPRQYENILWGIAIEWYMVVLGVIVSVYFLNKAHKVDYNFLIALISGIVASFSTMSGLLVWVLGVVIIIAKNENKKILLITWGGVSALVYLLYFWNWVHPSYHPKICFDISYFLASIGSPLVWDLTDSINAGALLLIMYIITLSLLLVHNKTKENIVWISLVLFSLLTSIMLTFGRSGFGVEQAMSSRYTTYTLLGIIGTYIILSKTFIIEHKQYPFQYITAMIAIVLIVGVYSISYTKGIEIEENLYKDRVIMADELLNYKNTSNDKLTKLYPSADIVKSYGKILEEHRLNVFSESSRSGKG